MATGTMLHATTCTTRAASASPHGNRLATPKRYAALDFIPPKGVARARDLSAQRALSPTTLRRMRSFFARHTVDQEAPGWASRSEPSARYIAWLLWGGDPGQRWADAMLRRMDRIDAKE
jgi:hypothetical protein